MRRFPRWSIAVLAALALGFGLKSVQAEEHSFVGSKRCMACHYKEYKSWQKTAMGSSFDLLKSGNRAEAKQAAGLDPTKDYTSDPECLPCHVTGYGKPGGFVDLDKTPQLAGVGCEWCHGAAGTYTKIEYMSLQNRNYKKADLVAVGLVDEVTEKQCTSCHNESSPTHKEFTFDTSKGMHEIYPLKYSH